VVDASTRTVAAAENTTSRRWRWRWRAANRSLRAAPASRRTDCRCRAAAA
jgi:hypothetical protein